MVKFLLSTALFAGAMADWSQMVNDVNLLLKEAFNGTDRTLTQSDMALVNQYGCWCYFEGDHGKGRGKPVDVIDSQCKILHDGYMCAIMDGELEGYECEPWTIPYASATGLGMGQKDMAYIQEECIANNPEADKCAQRACMVENWFVLEMFSLFVGGNAVDPALQHVNGFDSEDGCPINTDPLLKSEKACCGVYPIRFPFKIFNGERACCGMSTYDANLLTCCADGKAKMNC